MLFLIIPQHLLIEQCGVVVEGRVHRHRCGKCVVVRDPAGPAGAVDGSDADMPRAMKVVGACSLFSWFAVMYCGRMLPYLGTGN